MPGPVLLQPRAEDVEQRSRGPGPWPVLESTQGELLHKQYALMRHAFRLGGGIVASDELARLLRSRFWQPISLLARWIVKREVINFEWQSTTLVPLFQIDLSTMTIRPQVGEVLHELAGVFDDWDLALWFAQPNAWLDNMAPVAVLDIDANAVLDAARADRFIARG